MHNVLVSSLLVGTLLVGSAPATNIYPSVSVVSTKAQSNVGYDSELSVITIKPNSTGKTYFSYKIDGAYPTYEKDKVCFFNADGSLKEEKNNMRGKTIFSDDMKTWIDVTKDTPRVSPDSEYYNRMRAGDCEVVLPYSEVNKTNEFYIPVDKVGTKITVSVANVAEDGTVSKIQNYSFTYLGVNSSQEVNINATIKRVAKTENSETVRISGDNISYVQVDSDIYSASKNSVDIRLTSNGEKKFLVYGADTAEPQVLTYTVEGLQASLDDELKNDKVDERAPKITTDAIPTKKQYKPIKFKVYTDEPCTISCNGVSTSGTELELTIAGNGDYLVTAIDKAGNYSEKTIKFKCFSDYSSTYELDRDKQWSNNSSGTNDSNSTSSSSEDSATSLPKTGSIAFTSLLGIGGALATCGVILLRKKKRK